jgi:hypothetical protein
MPPSGHDLHGSEDRAFAEGRDSGGEPADLAELWHGLSAGTVRVAGTSGALDQPHLIVDRSPSPRPTPSAREVALLKALLVGAPRLLVSFEHAVAQSYVASAAAGCLTAFGISPATPELTPLAVVIAAHTVEGGTT